MIPYTNLGLRTSLMVFEVRVGGGGGDAHAFLLRISRVK